MKGPQRTRDGPARPPAMALRGLLTARSLRSTSPSSARRSPSALSPSALANGGKKWQSDLANLVLVLTREHYLTLIFHILGRIARLLSGERLLYLRIPDYSGHNYICQYPINGRTVSSVQCKSTLPTNNALNAVLGSVCVCVCVCCASTHMRTLRLNPSTLNPNL